ncbi:MAG: PEPxxWA-CTERM sorting domain-containing protein [Chthoniobacteraceae bacterium]|nr:PEPxxWA-CTERM sorting domain-containing protein [Chthoniobacteraceae bacterium]
MKTKKFLALSTALTLGIAASAPAASVTWTGGGTSPFNWDNSLNWGGTPLASGYDLLFTGVANSLSSKNNVTGTYNLGAITFDSTAGAYVLSGNAIKFSSLTDNSATTETVNNYITLAGNRTIGVSSASGNLILGGVISSGASSFGFTKTGAGTLTLGNVTSTYNGATTVSAGKLVVNGALSNTSGVSVASGAELNVTGSISTSAIITLNGKLSGNGQVGTVAASNTATVSPGGDGVIGTLSTGAFTLASTSGITFDLNATDHTAGGAINDLISVSGNLTLDGVLGINAIGGNLAPGRYTLFDYSGTLTDNTLDLNSTFLASYAGSYIDTTTAANEVSLVVVPEPATWAMLVGGFGLLAFGQKLRRQFIA